MKITLFIDSLCSGGAQRQLVGLAKLLKDRNYHVTVLTYHKNEFYLPFLKENSITYQYLQKAENKKTRIYHIVRYLIKQNPDVLISYLSTPNIIACIAKLFLKKTFLVVSERNTSLSVAKNEKIRFCLYKLANKIVPNSYSQEDFIIRNFPSLKNKICTITNFVDTDYFKPLENKQKNKIPVIISVGRITPQKNILNYLKALKIVADKGFYFRAIWFGNTDNMEYHNKCITLLGELNLNNYFEFRPATKSILVEYQNADIFCLPSNYEGFPNVVCEAMCCGLPILCSNVCDNPMIVKEGKNGFLFDPKKVLNIASQISMMLDLTEKERLIIGEHNRIDSLSKFSKESFVDNYLGIIQ